MIKLTVLHYKTKVEALERFHKVSEYYEKLVHEWEISMNKGQITDESYIDKPFIEPFEFENDDYIITELSLRVRTKDILYYKETKNETTEICLVDETSFIIKESIEELDYMFGISK